MSAAPASIAERPLPVTILSGFLGVGKTSLLNRLLREPGFARTAVVINEFGAIGIDHLLVEPIDGEMVLLASGCLCCAARGDLMGALARLVRRRAAGEIAFDRIVVETSGLADPAPVLNAGLAEPGLWSAITIETVVVLVDACSGAAVLDRYGEAVRQVAVADRILLSKLDLTQADTAPDLLARLRQINPVAAIGSAAEATAEAFAAPERAGRRFIAEPAIGAAVHSAGIVATVLHGGTLDPLRLHHFVLLQQQRYGARLLRLKGLVALADDPSRPAVLQAVQHRLHPVRRLDAWPDADHGSRIVVITEDVPTGAVQGLWDAFFGPPGIDRPDAQALSQGFERGAGLFA